jgi:hypothetical protein
MNTKTCNILTNELRPSRSKSWSNIRIQMSVVSISIYNSGTRKTKRIKHKKKSNKKIKSFIIICIDICIDYICIHMRVYDRKRKCFFEAQQKEDDYGL